MYICKMKRHSTSDLFCIFIFYFILCKDALKVDIFQCVFFNVEQFFKCFILMKFINALSLLTKFSFCSIFKIYNYYVFLYCFYILYKKCTSATITVLFHYRIQLEF